MKKIILGLSVAIAIASPASHAKGSKRSAGNQEYQTTTLVSDCTSESAGRIVVYSYSGVLAVRYGGAFGSQLRESAEGFVSSYFRFSSDLTTASDSWGNVYACSIQNKLVDKYKPRGSNDEFWKGAAEYDRRHPNPGPWYDKNGELCSNAEFFTDSNYCSGRHHKK